MTDNDDLSEIKRQIKIARKHIKRVMDMRAYIACTMTGAIGAARFEIDFPEPDIAHVYQCMLGQRVTGAIVYRLSFGKQLKWVGLSHPWGVKPADIVIE